MNQKSGTWALEPLYAGFEAPKFTNDYSALQQLLEELKILVSAPAEDAVSGVRRIVDAIEQYRLLCDRSPRRF